MTAGATKPTRDISAISDHQRKAMQWQHTRCRIGSTVFKDRYDGAQDALGTPEEAWDLWERLTEDLREERLKSVAMFGTLFDGSVFTMIIRGNENINLMTGACATMLQRIIAYEEQD